MLELSGENILLLLVVLFLLYFFMCKCRSRVEGFNVCKPDDKGQCPSIAAACPGPQYDDAVARGEDGCCDVNYDSEAKCSQCLKSYLCEFSDIGRGRSDPPLLGDRPLADDDINVFKLIYDQEVAQGGHPPTTMTLSGDEFPTGYIPPWRDATLVPSDGPPASPTPAVSPADFEKDKPFLTDHYCSKGPIKMDDGKTIDCWDRNRTWNMFNISKNAKFVNDFLPTFLPGGKKGDINKCYEVWLPTESYLGHTIPKYINKQVDDGKNKLEVGGCDSSTNGNYIQFRQDGYLDLRKGPLGGMPKYLPFTEWQKPDTDGDSLNPYPLPGPCGLITDKTYYYVRDSEVLCNSSVNNEAQNCYWDASNTTCKAKLSNDRFYGDAEACRKQLCNNKGDCEEGYKTKPLSEITCTDCFCSSGDNCEKPLGKNVILNGNTCGDPTCKGKTRGTCQKGYSCWSDSMGLGRTQEMGAASAIPFFGQVIDLGMVIKDKIDPDYRCEAGTLSELAANSRII